MIVSRVRPVAIACRAVVPVVVLAEPECCPGRHYANCHTCIASNGVSGQIVRSRWIGSSVHSEVHYSISVLVAGAFSSEGTSNFHLPDHCGVDRVEADGDPPEGVDISV